LGSYSLEKLWWIDFLVWNVNGAAERVEERIRMTEWFSVFCFLKIVFEVTSFQTKFCTYSNRKQFSVLTLENKLLRTENLK